MADINTTIDRATQISRNVAATLDRRLRTARERNTKHVQEASSAYLAATPWARNPVELRWTASAARA